MSKVKPLSISLFLIFLTSMLIGCSSHQTRVANILADTYRKQGASEFYIAIQTGDLPKIKRLVSAGEDIEKVLMAKKSASQYFKDDVYQSALSIATHQFATGVTEKKKAVVMYFLEQGADANGHSYSDDMLNIYDKSGTLARLIKPYRTEGQANRSTITMIAKQSSNMGASDLAVAIKGDNLKKVKQLVLSGANIDEVLVMKKGVSEYIKDDLHQSALSLAIQQFMHGATQNRKAIVNFLLEQGADANGTSFSDKMLKIYDKSGTLAKLIKPYREEGKQNRSTIKVMEKIYRDMGYSELALAIMRDDLGRIQSLILSGEDIHNVPTIRNHKSLPDQEQPAIVLAATQFSRGVTKKRKSIVKYFLEQGADANNIQLSDRVLNAYDKSGALSEIIKPYRNNTETIVHNKQDSKKTSNFQQTVAVKQGNQQSELEQLRMEVARLAKQITNGNTAHTPASQAIQHKVMPQNRKRLALVIGNSQYTYGALKNPKNDSFDIANALKSLKFEVILKVNVNREQMERAIDQFSSRLNQGGIGLFYYAGHGVQVNGENYLIPIDAKINRQSDVKYKAVNLGQVLDGMGQARSGLNIAILDACRDNPLPKSFRSSGNRGLARVNSPDGTLLAFSTAPGRTASDGEGRNGLYTHYLLEHMRKKNISIERILKLVSRDVKQASGNKQTPWMESSFTGDFFFKSTN